ncbi:hypothetical protein ADT26_19605 [Xanthomonas oryzae]|nr:hypothetical protein AXO1947_20170 [Xanthomonas oryzae pv. oryzae]KOR39764.1 hypothetical protein ADT26_19605 [Xanthomonas oryzae]
MECVGAGAVAAVAGHHRQWIGISQVQHVASLTHTDQHFAQLVEVLAPQAQLALIDDPATLDAPPLKRKSLSLHWELRNL